MPLYTPWTPRIADTGRKTFWKKVPKVLLLLKKKQYGNVVGDIAFSGHHLGISIDIAAYTLGAKYIERHFTLNRAWKGTDQAASLEPTGLHKLCRDLKNTFLSFTSKNGKLLNSEKEQRVKLKSFK